MRGRLARRPAMLAVAVLAFGAGRLLGGEPAPVELVPMTVAHVKLDPEIQAAVVLLATGQKDRFLPIIIGQAEALAILRPLRNEPAPPRPMTHDLLADVIARLGGKLERAVVTSLRDNTFHAELVVRRGEAVVVIDSRPSDAMALALRAGAGILVARGVLDEAGLTPDKLREDDEAPKPPRRPLIDPDHAI